MCGAKRQATHSEIPFSSLQQVAHLSEQSRRPASNQRAAVDPPFPAKSRSPPNMYAYKNAKLNLALPCGSQI